MNKIEINDYRRIIEKEFVDKDLEIETSLSYISVGALGFFITINEKFILLQSAEYKFILVVSLIFLLLSFLLILYRKSRTSSQDLKLIQFLDNMKVDSENDDNELLLLWEKYHKELNKIRKFVYVCLGFGIGLQVLFLILNV